MINLLKSPYRYAPAGNPVVFTLSATSNDTVLFKSELVEANSLATIYTGNIFPTPITPTKASLNLSNQLSALVRSDVDNDEAIALTKDRNIIAYKLRATEYGVNTGGTLEALSTAYTTDSFYAFEANLDNITYTKQWNDTNYIIKSGSTGGKFLTHTPNYKKVNEWSSEQLYFIQSGFTYLGLNLITGDGSSYTFPYTGTSSYLIQAAVPAVKATATITLHDAYNETGDNVGIKIDGNIVGSVTATTNEQSNLSLASVLFNNMTSNFNFNFSAYTKSLSGNVITITAPFAGTEANGRVVTTYFPLSASSSSTGTTGTCATVTVEGYPLPYASDNVTISLVDPASAGGYIELCNFTATSGDAADWDTFTNHFVSEIGFNPYGYTVVKLDSYSFRITTPLADIAVAALWNGVTASILYSASLFFDFAGGVNAVSSGTTFYNQLSASTTNFSGGADAIPAISGATLSPMGRFQVSPKMFIEAGVPANKFNANQNYSVVVKNSGGTAVSETKIYKVEETDCNKEYVNVFLTNSLGGTDTYQFLAPQETVNSIRLSIKKNSLDLNSDTPLLTDGVYNKSNETYANTSKSSVRLSTKELTDAESKWLVELVNSKNWYIELSNNELLPVTLKTTDYTIQKARYSNTLIQFNFEFELPDNFLPLSEDSIIINQCRLLKLQLFIIH